MRIRIHVRIRRRLKQYQQKVTNLVNNFWNKITCSIHKTGKERYDIELDNDTIDILLPYSCHKQVVDEWHDIVKDFGPFACFMKKAH